MVKLLELSHQWPVRTSLWGRGNGPNGSWLISSETGETGRSLETALEQPWDNSCFLPAMYQRRWPRCIPKSEDGKKNKELRVERSESHTQHQATSSNTCAVAQKNGIQLTFWPLPSLFTGWRHRVSVQGGFCFRRGCLAAGKNANLPLASDNTIPKLQ